MARDNFDHNTESATFQLALDRPARILTDVKVEIGKATVKENIAFVMGVLAPLRGDRAEEKGEDIDSRDFVEISAHDFDKKMKSFRPTAQIEVDLTGGNNPIPLPPLTFESLADFSPAAVARKVDSLRQLLDLRTQLNHVRGRFGQDPDATRKINAIFDLINKDPKLAEELRTKLAAPPT